MDDELGDFGDTLRELVSAAGKAAIASKYSNQPAAAAPVSSMPAATAAAASKTGLSDSRYAAIGVAVVAAIIGVLVILMKRR